MKKYIGLLLAMLVIASMAIPYLAIADVTVPEPQGPPPVSVAETPAIPDLRPTIVYTTGADPPGTPIDLTPLLQAILSLCVTLITAFLIPWIRAKYSVEQRQRIAAVYRTVVYAAEQMFGAGNGEKKLDWAFKQLEAKGFIVDRAALEAEVRKMQALGDGLTAARAPNT